MLDRDYTVRISLKLYNNLLGDHFALQMLRQRLEDAKAKQEGESSAYIVVYEYEFPANPFSKEE